MSGSKFAEVLDAAKEMGFNIPEKKPTTGLPTIEVTNRELRDISKESIEALVAAQSDDPRIFVRGGALCRIRYDEKGNCVISDMLKEAEFRGVLARVADYVRCNAKGEPSPTAPPIDVVRDILYSVTKWPGINPLSMVVQSPVLRADGSILRDPGYDEASSMYYSASMPMELTIPALTQDAEWIALRTKIVNALEPYPEAKEAMLIAIRE